MRRIIAAFALALAVQAPPALAATKIDDPGLFLRDVYEALVKDQDRPAGDAGKSYDPPEDIYTPALAKAFSEERRDSKGDLGRLDFFYWVNGQDWKLSDIEMRRRTVWRRPDRQAINVSFKNFDQESSLVFYFQKIGGRWLIDEVESIDLVEGEEGYDWTLSVILKYAREEEGAE